MHCYAKSKTNRTYHIQGCNIPITIDYRHYGLGIGINLFRQLINTEILFVAYPESQNVALTPKCTHDRLVGEYGFTGVEMTNLATGDGLSGIVSGDLCTFGIPSRKCHAD